MPRSASPDDHELLTVSDAIHRGMSMREIAGLLYGDEAVDAQWYSDSLLRDRTRRRVHKALRLMHEKSRGTPTAP